MKSVPKFKPSQNSDLEAINNIIAEQNRPTVVTYTAEGEMAEQHSIISFSRLTI